MIAIYFTVDSLFYIIILLCDSIVFYRSQECTTVIVELHLAHNSQRNNREIFKSQRKASLDYMYMH